MGEGISHGVEHPFAAQLLLGGDGGAAIEVGKSACSTGVGIASQHRDGTRQCACRRCEPRESISDEPHELRRRTTVDQQVAQWIKAKDARLL
jgi:hypothetical protein